MDLILEIGLQTLKIVVFVLGAMGTILSLLLLFAPGLVQVLSDLLNKNMSLDKTLTVLNKTIRTDQLPYRYNIVFGLALIGGSIFFLVFLFFGFKITRFSNILSELIIHSLTLLGKISGFTGIVLGILLLFAPQKMHSIEEGLNAWVDTQPVIDRLNKSYQGVDNIFLRYPVWFGISGLVASMILMALSMISMFG